MPHHTTDLVSIDAATLEEVGGGTVSSGGSGSSDQLATALQSIQSSIANLSKTNSSSPFGSLSQMLPLLLMMRGGGGGCGCGRPGCCH